ncbi:hypothetical protein F0U59_23405 [Archangium gephyra]|nr:hypothetical protein F0U59_23405 [Archangium gephyra]
MFVAFSASLSEFTRSVDKLLDDVQEMADGVASAMGEAAGAIGDFSDGLLSVAAAAGAAVAGAAEYSDAAAQASDDLKKSMLQLSAEVGATFVPLVRELNQGVRTLTATWRGMSAESKAQIVEAVRYAAVIGAAGKATSMALTWTKSLVEGVGLMASGFRKVLPAVGGASGALKGLTAMAQKVGVALTYVRQAAAGQVFADIAKSVSGIGPSLRTLPAAIAGIGKSFIGALPQIAATALPLLAVAAAVGAIALLAGSLYKSWDDLKALFKDSTAGIVEDMKNLGERIANFFGQLMDGVKQLISDLATAMLNAVFDRVKAVARFLENVARTLERNDLADNIAQVQNLSADGFMNKLKERGEQIGDAIANSARKAGEELDKATKGVRAGVQYGLKQSVEGAKELGNKLLQALPIDEIMSLKDKLVGFLPKMGNPDDVEVLRDREIELGKVDVTSGLPDSVRAFAKGADPVMRAYLDGLKENAKAVAEAMQQARDSLASAFMSRTGEISSIIQTAQQGFAAGGPLGAVVSVIGDLLTRSESFRAIIEMVNNIVQMVADSLGQLLTAVQPLVGAISMVVKSVMGALTPVFTWIGKALEPFTPVLVMVSHLINALAPVFQIFAGVLQILEMPLKLLVNVALRVLFEGIKYLSMGILWVAEGIGNVWNGIVTAVQSVLNALGNIELFGGKPFDFLLDWGTSLESMKIDTDALADAYGHLHDMTWETAQAQAEQAAAVTRNNEAIKEATEALTNVPSGWRAARAKYLAQDPRDMGGGGVGPGAPGGTGAPGTSGPARTTVVVHQTITTHSPEETSRMVRRRLDDIAFRQTGGRAGLYGGTP